MNVSEFTGLLVLLGAAVREYSDKGWLDKYGRHREGVRYILGHITISLGRYNDRPLDPLQLTMLDWARFTRIDGPADGKTFCLVLKHLRLLGHDC